MSLVYNFRYSFLTCLWIRGSAGSNPNVDVNTTKWATEYRVEYFQPPYMSMTRPCYTGKPDKIGYGESFTLKVDNPGHAKDFKGMINFS
jgi:hypothetical protein